jgi:hypothetical protein
MGQAALKCARRAGRGRTVFVQARHGARCGIRRARAAASRCPRLESRLQRCGTGGRGKITAAGRRLRGALMQRHRSRPPARCESLARSAEIRASAGGPAAPGGSAATARSVSAASTASTSASGAARRSAGRPAAGRATRCVGRVDLAIVFVDAKHHGAPRRRDGGDWAQPGDGDSLHEIRIAHFHDSERSGAEPWMRAWLGPGVSLR